MKLTPTKIIIALILLLIIAGAAYWQFFVRTGSPTDSTATDNQPNGFIPLDRPGGSSGAGSGTIPGGTSGNVNTGSTTSTTGTKVKIPTLRLLSNTPVGGYGASTTGTINAKAASTTTAIRWIDRGRGNIYEALGNTLDVVTLSNTVVPMIVESVWNKNLTAFDALTLSKESDMANGIYAELKPRIIPKVVAATSTPDRTATSTTSSANNTTNNNKTENLTPYELKGKSLLKNIASYAVSPKKDRLFIFVNDNGTGVGYTTNFDGSAPTQIFTTPLTQVNVEWPSDNVIAITTKGGADARGFLYFVDPKSGVWKKILGPLPGLSTKVSVDAKYVFISAASNDDNIVTSVYNVASRSGTDGVIRTLADKCVWGNFYKEMLYCAVPSQPVKGTYPDDWYKGTVSFIDKIWQTNVTTGEIKLVSSIVDTSDRVIDAFNLGLDTKDNFLIFMNKNDLSLWSLDLVSGN